MGHVKRNYSRLRLEAVALREGPVGGKVRPTGNARPEDNKPGNPENKVRNENNQRQGQVFVLIPGDVRTNEDVVEPVI